MNKSTRPSAPAVGPGAVADSVGGRAVAGDTVRPRPDTVAVFTRFAGYAVRGTDEWSFKVCGLPKVHFLRPDPFPNAELNQRYRFRASRVLVPVYFELRGRVVPDTVTMGVNRYTSVMEVKEVLPEVEGAKRDCPPPGRGSLIARQR